MDPINHVKCELRVAFLLTCHNRKEVTLKCIESIFSQNYQFGEMAVFIVDDASQDGTSQAIKLRFPSVTIIQGTGNLYWNRGMCLAFQNAIKGCFDYYCLLNDDTTLFPDAVSIFFQTESSLPSKERKKAILVGATKDPLTGKITYGGLKRASVIIPTKFATVEPTGGPEPVDTFNCNAVLIPSLIIKSVGFLDPFYSHAFGDVDYGLRVGQSGFPSYLTTKAVGVCELAKYRTVFSDFSGSIKRRIASIRNPKGFPPADWGHFLIRHGGFFWFIFFLNPYIRFFILSFFHILSSKNRKS